MKVRVDPTKCQAHGDCNGICPDVFKLDEWGYAYSDDDGLVPRELEGSVENAIAACPEDAITASV